MKSSLWIIVAQGFLIAWFEYDVWRMNRGRYNERKKWRVDKRKQAAKKTEVAVVPDQKAS